jgi:hypothetical protein
MTPYYAALEVIGYILFYLMTTLLARNLIGLSEAKGGSFVS